MSVPSSRKHDKKSFFKYLSVASAKAVLKNKSLRWSSPLLFNDPFDVPREIMFGFSPEELSNAIRKRFISLIRNPPNDQSHLISSLQIILAQIKEGPDLAGKLINELENGEGPWFLSDGKSTDAFKEMWREAIPGLRILCFSEKPDVTSMWYHYCDKYAGAVFEFYCHDDLDSAWLLAEPIKYLDDISELFGVDSWAKMITMQADISIEELLSLSSYYKTSDWSYEKEWRIRTFMRQGEGEHFTDYKFNPHELTTIYLGPLMNEADKKEMSTLATGFPQVKIIQVSIGIDRRFHYEEVMS